MHVGVGDPDSTEWLVGKENFLESAATAPISLTAVN